MDRLDKVLGKQTSFSRKEAKKMIHDGRVFVNHVAVRKTDWKVMDTDLIEIDSKPLKIQNHIYLVFHKPKGCVSATEDKNYMTVLDYVPEEYRHRDLFPAGRLDKDTTGLMILTDDGVFAHEILAPKKHVSKKYWVQIDIPLNDQMVQGFQKGVSLKDGICYPSCLEILNQYEGIVTLTEGRYHQIKRMFGVYGAKVLELKRIQMGEFFLPDDLGEGECRELSEEELSKIRG